MTYRAIDALTNDPLFAGRVRACTTEQAEIYKDDGRPDLVALANRTLLGDGTATMCFVRIAAASPGLAEKSGDPPNQTQILDADILASVQANWPVVAGLLFDDKGAPL